MQILITGANGFIGSQLVNYLALNHEVYAVSRASIVSDKKNISVINIDLSQSNFSKSLPANIDVVVHLAQSRFYRSDHVCADDIFRLNVGAPQQLLEWAKEGKNVKHFIYASTANVYAMNDDLINENSTLEPSSFYAKSKLMGELLTESYASYFKYHNLRLFTVYGPSQQGMLIPILLNKVMSDSPIQIYGEKGMSLTPICVGDICRIMRSLIERPITSGCLNLGGKEVLSILEIVEHIAYASNRKPKLEFLPANAQSGWCADMTKFDDLFPNYGFTAFKQGIAQMLTAAVRQIETISEKVI